MAKKAESYESLINKLENILEKMESSEISLDDTLNLYEDGVKISNKLYKILNEAEGKIKLISEKDGSLKETEINGPEMEDV